MTRKGTPLVTIVATVHPCLVVTDYSRLLLLWFLDPFCQMTNGERRLIDLLSACQGLSQFYIGLCSLMVPHKLLMPFEQTSNLAPPAQEGRKQYRIILLIFFRQMGNQSSRREGL